jgi:uncharacterized protein (TIGR03083 family)
VTNDAGSGEERLRPDDKALLLERIDRSWTALDEAVRSLSEQQLTAPGADGWAIKDHLVHVAAWERSALALLQRRPRYEGLGVDEATYESHDVDRVNDAIYRNNRERLLAEVLQDFRETHARTRAVIAGLSPEDLARPYAQYLPEPGGEDTGPQRPVLDWVVGNTYAHFDEHRDWIRARSGG